MDKATYLDMCEALGTEPDPKDMPVEYSDLHYECRIALEAYHIMPSMWTGMGDYLGKDFTGSAAVFDLLNINSNRLEILQMMQIIDSEVSKSISAKQKAANKKVK